MAKRNASARPRSRNYSKTDTGPMREQTALNPYYDIPVPYGQSLVPDAHPYVDFPPSGARDYDITVSPHMAADPYTAIFGQVDPNAPDTGPAVVVNPREFGVTGWGDNNSQQFQSGPTNNVILNKSLEQGMGVGPERRWMHYPSPDNPNPYRRMNAFLRDGMDAYSADVYRPEQVAYWWQALLNEDYVATSKATSPVNPVATQPPSVPFTAIVPDQGTGTNPYYG